MEVENIYGSDHISKLIKSIVDTLDLNNCSDTNIVVNPPVNFDENDEVSITCTACQKSFMSRFHYRRRCKDCQLLYNQKHVSNCPDCGDTYYAYLSDGRVFDKCYKCYLNTVKKCQKCERKAYNGYCLCKTCYEDTRDKEMFEFRPVVVREKHVFIESDDESGEEKNTDDFESNLDKCESVSCSNMTKLRFCVSCLEKYKIIVIE